jgi:pantoate--beta-alanine ligase
MVQDLEIPLTLKMLPIKRDSNGLALSSRNQYLNSEQMIAALYFPKTLQKIENLILEKQPYELIEEIKQVELKNPNWDYLEILDSENLEKINPKTKEAVIIGAYRLGNTRLLDNRLVTIHA